MSEIMPPNEFVMCIRKLMEEEMEAINIIRKAFNGMKADAIEFYFVAGDSVDTTTKQWLSIFDITCSAKTEEVAE